MGLVKEQMERCTISMEPVDWATVHKVARDMGVASRSAGVRFIIREWVRMKKAAYEQYKQNDDAIAVLQEIRRCATTRKGDLIEVAFLPQLYEQVEAVLDSAADERR